MLDNLRERELRVSADMCLLLGSFLTVGYTASECATVISDSSLMQMTLFFFFFVLRFCVCAFPPRSIHSSRDSALLSSSCLLILLYFTEHASFPLHLQSPLMAQQLDRQVQEAIERSRLIAAFARSFRPNPQGLDNHANLWRQMLQNAAEGNEASFSESQDGQFVNEACSIEFERMVAGIALQRGPLANPVLLEGEVFVGVIELSFNQADFFRAVFNMAKISHNHSPAMVADQLAQKYQWLSDWLDYAGANAVFRPSRIINEGRDRRTFHQKADGIYALTFEGFHLVFGVLMPGHLQLLECYEVPRFCEYTQMVNWAKALYLRKIQPAPFQLP